MKIFKLLFGALVYLAALGVGSEYSAAAQSMHVAPTGNDANSGAANAPLRNIQTALSRAANGDTIKVAAGMYAENVTTRVRVILRGGYDATFLEPARDIFKNRSVFRSAAGTYFSDANSSTVDGFIFDGSVGASKAVVVTAGHPIVTHNVFHSFFSSFATGVDVSAGASVTVKNNTFANNILSGGGTLIYSLYIRGNADGLAVVENNIVFNNNVGIYLSAAGITANYNCVFGNTYRNYDGPNAAPGANDLAVNPVFVNASNSDFRLKASSPCNDAGNPADPVGDEPAPNGGRIDMGAYGGTKNATVAALNPSTHVSTLGNDSNSGTVTAPLRTIQAALTSAVGDTIKVAAGIYSEGLLIPAKVVLRGGYDESFAEPQRDIFANLTTLRGISATMIYDRFGSAIDGLFLDGNAVAQIGFDIGSGSVVTHNIVTRISSGSGYGIKISGNAMVINNTVRSCTRAISIESGSAGSTVKNNILANNSFALSNSAANGIARYNDFFSNSFNYVGSFTMPGLGDLAVDPQFRNATANDFRLLPTSLCVNAGDPADPVSEEPEPNGGRIDMGAYGGTKNAPAVSGANQPPVVANTISAQTLTVGGSSFTLNLNAAPAIFSDPDGDALTYTANSSATGVATATISGSTLTVAPVAGGTATITITANDGKGGTVSTTFTVTVNRPPVVFNAISDQSLTVGQGTRAFDLNAVFSDPDGDKLSYTPSSSAPGIATAIIVGGNTLNVSPVSVGVATITVAADDGRGGIVAMMFKATVLAPNRAPTVANPISNQTLAVGGSSFTRDLNASPEVFSDPDGDALSYTASSSAAGVATATITGSTLRVSPVASGTATITVTANDGRSGTISTTFTATVGTASNNPPVVANAIPNQSLMVGGASFTRDLNASPAVFNDPDGDALTYTASSSATNIATANISGSTLTVAPVAADNAMITITANDNKGGTVSTTFTVTVSPAVNRPPVVANAIPNQTLTVGGASFVRDLNAALPVFSDPDGDALIYAIDSSVPSVATASISISTLTVAPVTAGNATITVTASDNRGGTVSTNFTVTVTEANRGPMVTNVISNQTLTVGGAPFTRDLNASPVVFSDPDGDALTYTVSSNATNIAAASISGSTLTVAPVAAGNATITVTADDGRGGSISTMFGVTVSARINQPPSITHSPSSPQPENQLIVVQANIIDDTGINSVQLSYRRGGETGFTMTTMTPTSGSSYQGTIPASIADSRGVEYFIVATDADNAPTRQPASPNVFSIQIQVSNVANPTAQPGGSAQAAYRFISVPMQANDPSVAAVLEDDLGAYANTVWRFFGLMTGQPLSNKSPYVELSQTGVFAPGKSFFLIVRDAGKIIDSGPGRSVWTDQEFSIAVEVGHNFVASPFNFTIPAGKMRLQSGGPITLRTYNGSFVTAEAMSPWEGYYLANNRSTSDTLFVNPNLSSPVGVQPVTKAPSSGWRLQILASCAQARDIENFAGIATTSADSWDENDLVEPPPIGEYVSVYFPHPEWQKPLYRYSDDMRSASNPNQKWRFVVESNIDNEILTLRFDGLKEIEANLAVFLVDEEMKYKQNLRENAVYQYQTRGLERAKTFTLIVGKDEFVAGQTAGVQGAPENFVLEQNFPNPFNPETAIRFGLPQQSVVTIKIFDLAGREVATVLNRVELPAGRHQRTWNGRDNQGRPVGSSLYFYQIIAGSFSKTMKLTLMK